MRTRRAGLVVALVASALTPARRLDVGADPPQSELAADWPAERADPESRAEEVAAESQGEVAAAFKEVAPGAEEERPESGFSATEARALAPHPDDEPQPDLGTVVEPVDGGPEVEALSRRSNSRWSPARTSLASRRPGPNWR